MCFFWDLWICHHPVISRIDHDSRGTSGYTPLSHTKYDLENHFHPSSLLGKWTATLLNTLKTCSSHEWSSNLVLDIHIFSSTDCTYSLARGFFCLFVVWKNATWITGFVLQTWVVKMVMKTQLGHKMMLVFLVVQNISLCQIPGQNLVPPHQKYPQ